MNTSGSLLHYIFNCLSKGFFVLLFCFIAFPLSIQAQDKIQQFETEKVELPSPRGALLRSFVMPGWGHYYADNENWNRGKYHLAGEVVLLLSYFGLDARAGYLENDFMTLAKSKAGTDLSGRSRDFLIAVGNYDNLNDYNDAQLQSRNWDQVFPTTAENQWAWETSDYRIQYQDTRSRVDRINGQLPTLATFMVINRLVSGISAFIQARDRSANIPQARLSYLHSNNEVGFKATLKFRF